MTSSTRQPRGSGSRRRVRPAPTGQSYPAPRPSRQPMPRQSYRPATAKRTSEKPRRRARKPHTIDMTTMCATLLLLIYGLIALFSASYSSALYSQGSATYFIVVRQLRWAAVGLVAMYVLSPHRLPRLRHGGKSGHRHQRCAADPGPYPGRRHHDQGRDTLAVRLSAVRARAGYRPSSRSPRGPRPSTRICST